jgi:hypothetical protein
MPRSRSSCARIPCRTKVNWPIGLRPVQYLVPTDRRLESVRAGACDPLLLHRAGWVLSRYIVRWDLRERMKESDIDVILQGARRSMPGPNRRIISDNGPQFVARDWKEFICISGMTHVRTSPFYPQSNGKLERWHKSLQRECIRPLTLDDGMLLIETYVAYCQTTGTSNCCPSQCEARSIAQACDRTGT